MERKGSTEGKHHLYFLLCNIADRLKETVCGLKQLKAAEHRDEQAVNQEEDLISAQTS